MNEMGESAAAREMRMQVHEASKDPIKFAQMMGQLQAQTGPSPEAQAAMQQAQQAKAVWMTVYLERCKAIATDMRAPGGDEALRALVEQAAALASRVVVAAKESGNL